MVENIHLNTVTKPSVALNSEPKKAQDETNVKVYSFARKFFEGFALILANFVFLGFINVFKVVRDEYSPVFFSSAVKGTNNSTNRQNPKDNSLSDFENRGTSAEDAPQTVSVDDKGTSPENTPQAVSVDDKGTSPEGAPQTASVGEKGTSDEGAPQAVSIQEFQKNIFV